MLHGTVQIAGVGNLAVSPNILWSWAIACCAGTLLAASPALMGSSAPPGTSSSLPGTAVIFVDEGDDGTGIGNNQRPIPSKSSSALSLRSPRPLRPAPRL